MVNTCLEIVWLRYLLQDLKVACNLAAQLFCDNQATLKSSFCPWDFAFQKQSDIDNLLQLRLGRLSESRDGQYFLGDSLVAISVVGFKGAM